METSFRTDFLPKFIPVHIKDLKLWEFQTLMQGSMIVYQYELCFTQLSHFAEALFKLESQRIRRFVDGLRDDIKLHMTCIDHVTYEDAVRRTYLGQGAFAASGGYASVETYSVHSNQAAAHSPAAEAVSEAEAGRPDETVSSAATTVPPSQHVL